MAENINEVLGVQEETPQKTNAETPISTTPKAETPKAESSSDDSAESTLNVIAYITLIVGILAAVLYFFISAGIGEITSVVLGEAFKIIFTSVVAWAVMRVLANISLTLKEINFKIKRQ